MGRLGHQELAQPLEEGLQIRGLDFLGSFGPLPGHIGDILLVAPDRNLLLQQRVRAQDDGVGQLNACCWVTGASCI